MLTLRHWIRERPQGHDRERGAVMVMFTILLVVMLGFAALVVDLGFQSEHVRQIQNAADAAALAGAQDLPNVTAAANTVETYAATNLGVNTLAWSSCTAATFAAGWTYSAATQCIQFDPSFTQVYVKIPVQTSATDFGRVFGVNSLSATRLAVARVVTAGFGSIQPFALFSGFQAGLSCMKQGPSGHRIATCDDPTTGNFNLLDITQYGNSTLSTPTRCGNSFQRNRMIDNIAIGADHVFSTLDDPDAYNGMAVDDACGVPFPNTLPPRTGNDVSAFDTGLVHGTSTDTSDGGGARLTRIPSSSVWPGYPTATAMGRTLDNKPLWDFIPYGLSTSGANAVPASCRRETFDALLSGPLATLQATMETALETCFTDYDSGGYTGVVFGANTDPSGAAEIPDDLYDIQLSPRFAYVPQFIQAIPPNGSSGDLNIGSFRAIYMEDVYANCSTGCSVDFAPGPWNTTPLGRSNDTAEAMTAWVFPPTMLPGNLGTTPTSIGQNTYVQLVK